MRYKNFTRKNISSTIYKNIGFSKNLSSRIIDDFFDIISNELVNFKKVKISSFGTLQTLLKKERIGRNPKNKKIAKISARKIVKFTASKIFKNKINKS
jgi:integration host factor subunit alpha